MHRTFCKPLIAVFLLCVPALRGQDAPHDPRSVQPERPTVATHAHTVAPGYIELETGIQGDRVAAGSRTYATQSVIKAGLAEHAQLNIVIPTLFSAQGSQGGVGDLSIGVKLRLLDDNPVLGDFAILPSVKFPTASQSRGLGSGAYDVGITVITSYDLSGVAMDLNAICTRESVSTAYAHNTALLTASFGATVSNRLGWVLEFFGEPVIDGSSLPSTASILTGPTFLVSTAFAIDAGIIRSVHGPATNSLYGGLVWNLGKLIPSGVLGARRRP